MLCDTPWNHKKDKKQNSHVQQRIPMNNKYIIEWYFTITERILARWFVSETDKYDMARESSLIGQWNQPPVARGSTWVVSILWRHIRV